MRAGQKPRPLTEAQRETVASNLGLVGMQINRMLFWGSRDASFPEYWEELFQEGCLGLIQAVQAYEPSSGMTFATYAIPRIHYAARMALRRYRETIRLPERLGRSQGGRTEDSGTTPATSPLSRSRRMQPDSARASPSSKPPVPRVRSYQPNEMDALPAKGSDGVTGARDSGTPDAGDCVTIGDMLRQKLEAAVDEVVERLGVSTKSRGDRGVLARRVADQRLLVPEVEFRASLREIARETGSSYGRVAACEALLVNDVRRHLSDDAEFGLLMKASARRESGTVSAVDDELRRALRDGVTDRMAGVFGELPRKERADMLLAVLERAGVDADSLMRRHAEDLADAERAQLLTRMSRGIGVADTQPWAKCPRRGELAKAVLEV